MTAQMPITPTPLKNKPPLRPLKWGIGLLMGAVAAWFLWQWANDMSGVRREAPKVPTIIPLPPPPPLPMPLVLPLPELTVFREFWLPCGVRFSSVSEAGWLLL